MHILPKYTLKNENGFGIIEALMVFALVVLLGGASYFIYKNHHKTTTTTVAPKSTHKSTAPAAQAFQLPGGWSWYTSSQYGFKVAYPNIWGQPKPSITKGQTGTDYSVTFSPGPAYNGAVSRNQITVGFASDDYAVQGDKNNLVGPYANKAAIQSKLNAITSGAWQGGPILAHDATGFTWLTASSSTHVLEVDKMVYLPKLDVSGVFDSYQIVDAPATCSTTALSPNTQQWCMNQNVLDELNDVVASVQSL